MKLVRLKMFKVQIYTYSGTGTCVYVQLSFLTIKYDLKMAQNILRDIFLAVLAMITTTTTFYLLKVLTLFWSIVKMKNCI